MTNLLIKRISESLRGNWICIILFSLVLPWTAQAKTITVGPNDTVHVETPFTGKIIFENTNVNRDVIPNNGHGIFVHGVGGHGITATGVGGHGITVPVPDRVIKLQHTTVPPAQKTYRVTRREVPGKKVKVRIEQGYRNGCPRLSDIKEYYGIVIVYDSLLIEGPTND